MQTWTLEFFVSVIHFVQHIADHIKIELNEYVKLAKKKVVNYEK